MPRPIVTDPVEVDQRRLWLETSPVSKVLRGLGVEQLNLIGQYRGLSAIRSGVKACLIFVVKKKSESRRDGFCANSWFLTYSKTAFRNA